MPQTPVTYSAAEAKAIRDQAAEPGTALHCPICKGDLVQYPPVTVKGRRLREVCCPQCNRCLMLPA